MKVETGEDGRRRLMLGPVEVAVVAMLPMMLGYMWVKSETERSSVIENLSKSNNTLVTQVGIMQEQLRVLNLQLANVPGLAERVIKLETKAEQNARDIEELRSVRGLR